MMPTVRPARPDDEAAVALLYEAAAPYFDVFAGSGERARRLLRSVWRRRGHTASYEVCRIAEVDGEVVGVLAAFPARAGERLARRFLGLTVTRMPAWRWPAILRHLRASATITPLPPAGALYVDALAVSEAVRRRGVARALLDDAAQQARASGSTGIALDTGVENEAAQALYAALGFRRTGERRTEDARTIRAVGGTGFVSYFRAV